MVSRKRITSCFKYFVIKCTDVSITFILDEMEPILFFSYKSNGIYITESRYEDMDDTRSVRQVMEENMTCIDQMFMTDTHGHSAMDSSNVLNPIDKLYSMQNSYFSVE